MNFYPASPICWRPCLVIPFFFFGSYSLRYLGGHFPQAPGFRPAKQILLANVRETLSLSIIFRRLASIRQTFHERRCRKSLGIQWNKNFFNEGKGEVSRKVRKSPIRSCYFRGLLAPSFRWLLCQTNKVKYSTVKCKPFWTVFRKIGVEKYKEF